MTTETRLPTSSEDDSDEEEHYLDIKEGKGRVAVASFWQLIWWRYRRHRVAVFSTFVVLIFYLIAAFSEFVAPYDPEAKFVKYKLHPPTPIHIVDADGNWRMPFIYQTVRERDPETFRNTYHEDTAIRHPIRLFPKANPMNCGVNSPSPPNSSASTFSRRSRASSSSAQTASAVTCSPASPTAPASPSPSA